METLRIGAAAALCLALFCVPAGAQTADEYLKRAAGAQDSNSRVPIFDEAIKKHPSDSRLYHKRGVAWGVMEYHDKALADFDRAVSLDALVPSYYHDRGLALHRLKRNEEAVRDFTKLIELEPGNARAYYLRAVAYTNLKDLEKAEPDLDRAVALDPKLADESSVRRMRGLMRSKRKTPAISIGAKPEAAADRSKPASGPAAEVPPASSAAVQDAKPEPEGAKAKALANKAKVRTNLKKYGEAAAVWTELLEVQPGYYPAYAERAYALHMAGEKERAAGDFEKAFAADPAQPRAFLLRGAARCAAGDFPAAAADLEKALQLDPAIKKEMLYSLTSGSVKRKKTCK